MWIRPLSGACAAVALGAALMFGLPATVRATVVFHNGSEDSSPPGSGEVDVRLVEENGIIFKLFSESTGHFLVEAYDPGLFSTGVLDAPINATGDSWDAYVVGLFGAEFFGFAGGLVPDADPLTFGGTFAENKIEFLGGAGVSVGFSAIDRTGPNPTLIIVFDDPVDTGESFGLGFIVQDVGIVEEQYAMFQAPITDFDTPVPEPLTATTMILGLVLVPVLLTRRRGRVVSSVNGA